MEDWQFESLGRMFAQISRELEAQSLTIANIAARLKPVEPTKETIREAIIKIGNDMQTVSQREGINLAWKNDVDHSKEIPEHADD